MAWERLRSRFPTDALHKLGILPLFSALAIGALGGWAFSRLGLPLPWLLGSMSACTLAALMRVPLAVPRIVRPPMSAILGVMLGASFSAEFISRIGTLLPTLLGLVVFLAACGATCTAYLRLVARFDLTTAYFAGMPGGLIEMVLLGEERGGDGRLIGLIHSARILLLVFTLPFLVQFIGSTDLGPRGQPGIPVSETAWTSHLWLVATAGFGVLAGRILHLPARYLTGPMVVSAALHALDVTDFEPAIEIVNFAQLALGSFLGCRFVGTAPREVVRILVLSLGTTFILLALTLGFAAVVSRLSSYGIVPLILAYSPGGLAEMSLIALAMDVEVMFVVAHHIARVFLVVLGASLTFRFLDPARGGEAAGRARSRNRIEGE